MDLRPDHCGTNQFRSKGGSAINSTRETEISPSCRKPFDSDTNRDGDILGIDQRNQQSVRLNGHTRDQFVIIEEAMQRPLILIWSPAGRKLRGSNWSPQRVEQCLQLVVDVT